MAESKSTEVTRADARRQRALANVQLREVCRPHAALAWGTLAQLRAAGYVPADLEINEQARVGTEWADDAGRRCALRPYARHQWEARRAWLPHERDELRLIEAERWRQHEAESARQREVAAKRVRLATDAQYFPRSLESYRHSVDAWADHVLSVIERLADGHTYPGCSIDEDSQDAVRAAIASIQATLAAATYRYDGRHGDKLRAELAAFDARNDAQLQRVLRRTMAQ